jgi:hypothetical protein
MDLPSVLNGWNYYKLWRPVFGRIPAQLFARFIPSPDGLFQALCPGGAEKIFIFLAEKCYSFCLWV